MRPAAVDYLRSLEKFGMRPGLERIEALLGLMSSPHRAYHSAHVAGTNGKGSTCAILYAILLASGVKGGLFTKPHLQTYRERMRANGRLIPSETLEELVALVGQLTPSIESSPGIGAPTEFESGVAVAFEYFRRSGVELAVIETGMGGTWDATNVISPDVCAITSIAMDHSERLGSTLTDVAAQKAGIMKSGVPVVIAEWPGRTHEVMAVFLGRASELGCPVINVSEQYVWTLNGRGWEGQDFDIRGPEGLLYANLKTGLLGDHQLNNAVTAVACALALSDRGWPIDEGSIRKGLADVVWPGRLELVSESPRVLLDGAPNPEGASALARALSQLSGMGPKRTRVHLVVGMSSDKDVDDMLLPLLPIADTMVATKAEFARLGVHPPSAIVSAARRLRPELPVREEAQAQSAVRVAVDLAAPEDLVCVCGSLYLVGEVRGIWRGAE